MSIAGFTATDLRAAKYTPGQLATLSGVPGGFTEKELSAAGWKGKSWEAW